MTNKSLSVQGALYFTPEFSMNSLALDCTFSPAYEKLMNVGAEHGKKTNATKAICKIYQHALKLKYVHRQSDLGLHGSCM